LWPKTFSFWLSFGPARNWLTYLERSVAIAMAQHYGQIPLLFVDGKYENFSLSLFLFFSFSLFLSLSLSLLLLF